MAYFQSNFVTMCWLAELVTTLNQRGVYLDSVMFNREASVH